MSDNLTNKYLFIMPLDAIFRGYESLRQGDFYVFIRHEENMYGGLCFLQGRGKLNIIIGSNCDQAFIESPVMKGIEA